MSFYHQRTLLCRIPVRISFSGGGTDLKSYYQIHGGAVLSTSISLYNYLFIKVRSDVAIKIFSSDYDTSEQYPDIKAVDNTGLLKIVKECLRYFNLPIGLDIYLSSDLPTGSGLGLSGAVTVNLVKALSSLKDQIMTKAELAEIASVIEIERLGRPIGKQDQYASSYGGLNFITFLKCKTKNEPDVIVEKLSLLPEIKKKLETSLMLFYTGRQRDSASVLSEQKKATEDSASKTTEALHQIKNIAYRMKDALEKGELENFGKLLHEAWQHKRSLTKNLSNAKIDRMYQIAIQNGALGGKLTGAGSGGFLLFFCPPSEQELLRKALTDKGLIEYPCQLEAEGCKILYSD